MQVQWSAIASQMAACIYVCLTLVDVCLKLLDMCLTLVHVCLTLISVSLTLIQVCLTLVYAGAMERDREPDGRVHPKYGGGCCLGHAPHA